MKKLLSLLSVLTISGTAVPTTIAASTYQKDTSSTCGFNVKDKKQTINNLEKLNRNKRGSAGTGFAQGIASVLEQFKPAEQIPNDGKYTTPEYVHLPPDQYKAYENKVNELHKQRKL